MSIKKTLFTALIAMFGMTATAQEKETRTEYVFNPHWYLQVQGGVQETLGEISASDLFSPNVQLGVGYQFNKVWGARLAINAWQSKGGSKLMGNKYKWKYNYVAPTIDATLNLTNLLCGYKPDRVVNFGLFAGIGANIGFNNDDAWDVANTMMATYPASITANDQYLRLIWDGTKTRFVGQFGANIDLRLTDRISIGLEASANTLPDSYNSKKAGNSDWYFNCLLGLKFNLGKTYTTREVEVVKACNCKPAEPKVIEKIIERVVEQPKPAETKQEVIEPIRRDVFFVIRGSQISNEEMQKVREIAEYMNKYPKSRVTITGYADKGTGNAKINKGYADKRAAVVANTLQTKFGISADRITTESKGDTEQPYAEQVKNRVSICVAQ